MKTKFLTKISSFIILFVMCAILLAGCSTPWEGPKTEDDVTGNGGLAVQKGDYLYFVNGYTSKSDMVDGDNKGEFEYSSIYKAKLNESNELEYDEDGKLLNCSKLVSKVGGYDDTALYIYGDYMYFASPYANTVTNSDLQQENNFKLTDFYQVKLDGSGLKTIYTTNNDSTDIQFGFYQTADSNDVNLVVYDSKKLVVVNCSTSHVATVSENVTNVALPKVTDFKYNNNQITKQESAVYYTRSGTEEENLSEGNVLAYSVIGENTEKQITKGVNTYAVKTVTKDALVVTIQNADYPNTCNYFITFDKQTGEPEFDLNDVLNQKLDSSGNSKVYLCAFEDGNPVGMITTNSKNKLVMLDYKNNNKAVVLNDTVALTPLKVIGNYVYGYDDSKSLYRINYKQALVSQDKASLLETIYESTKIVDEENSTTADDIYFDAKTNFTVIGNYVYFYMPYKGETETGYYLNRINMLNSEKTAELVGVVQADHIVVEDSEE